MMFNLKKLFLLPLLLMAMFTLAGCTNSTPQQNVPSRDAALKQFKKRGVTIYPDDNGQVLSLVLDGTEIVGDDLRYANSFPELRYISLSNTSIGDDGLKQIATLDKLEKLYLQKTNVSDAGLASLKKMHQLIILDLSGTKVTLQGVMQLSELKNLDYVNLSETTISDEEVIQLKQAMPHCRFER